LALLFIPAAFYSRFCSYYDKVEKFLLVEKKGVSATRGKRGKREARL